MRTVAVVVHDSKGRRTTADVAVCGCGSQVFSVFQVHGHDHFHLSCIVCETCMCPHGSCNNGKRSPQHGSNN